MRHGSEANRIRMLFRMGRNVTETSYRVVISGTPNGNRGASIGVGGASVRGCSRCCGVVGAVGVAVLGQCSDPFALSHDR